MNRGLAASGLLSYVLATSIAFSVAQSMFQVSASTSQWVGQNAILVEIFSASSVIAVITSFLHGHRTKGSGSVAGFFIASMAITLFAFLTLFVATLDVSGARMACRPGLARSLAHCSVAQPLDLLGEYLLLGLAAPGLLMIGLLAEMLLAKKGTVESSGKLAIAEPA